MTASARWPSKQQVVEALLEALQDQLVGLERTAAAARDETGSDESRPENQYDTRATEASYLARGLAQRIEELRAVVAWFNRQARHPHPQRQAGVGALVAVQLASAHEPELLYVARGGGVRVQVDGWAVRIVSPGSPLGGALTGLQAGDGGAFRGPKGEAEFEVEAVW